MICSLMRALNWVASQITCSMKQIPPHSISITKKSKLKENLWLFHLLDNDYDDRSGTYCNIQSNWHRGGHETENFHRWDGVQYMLQLYQPVRKT